jgi:hypothetical protein
MAKKKVFSEESRQQTMDGPMAKVIISTKLANHQYAFNETMIRQDRVKEYINENKS